MTDVLFTIALSVCWIIGFFISAQIIATQWDLIKRMEKLEKTNGTKDPFSSE